MLWLIQELLANHSHIYIVIDSGAASQSVIYMLWLIQELLANHSEFLSNLEKTNSADSRCTISDCFIMCKEKFLVYGMFCGNLTHAQETLDKVTLNQTMMDHVSVMYFHYH